MRFIEFCLTIIGFWPGFNTPDPNYELREDLWPELREEGTNEVRDGA